MTKKKVAEKVFDFDFSDNSQIRLLKVLCSLNDGESIKITTPTSGYEVVKRKNNELIIGKTEINLKTNELRVIMDIFSKVRFE